MERSVFAESGFYIGPTTLDCVKDFVDSGDLAAYEKAVSKGDLQGVIRFLVNCDWRKIGMQKLITREITKTSAEKWIGKYQLQVVDVVDASVSRQRGSMNKSERRMLRLQFSDGHSTIAGFEYQPLGKIGHDLVPGVKVLLKDPPMKNGFLLLSPDCVSCTGGSVPDLLEEYRMKQMGFSRSRQGQTEQGSETTGPPKFIPFKPKVEIQTVPEEKKHTLPLQSQGQKLPSEPKQVPENKTQSTQRSEPKLGGNRQLAPKPRHESQRSQQHHVEVHVKTKSDTHPSNTAPVTGHTDVNAQGNRKELHTKSKPTPSVTISLKQGTEAIDKTPISEPLPCSDPQVQSFQTTRTSKHLPTEVAKTTKPSFSGTEHSSQNRLLQQPSDVKKSTSDTTTAAFDHQPNQKSLDIQIKVKPDRPHHGHGFDAIERQKEPTRHVVKQPALIVSISTKPDPVEKKTEEKHSRLQDSVSQSRPKRQDRQLYQPPVARQQGRTGGSQDTRLAWEEARIEKLS